MENRKGIEKEGEKREWKKRFRGWKFVRQSLRG